MHLVSLVAFGCTRLRNQSLRVNKPFDYLKCNTLWDYLDSDKIPVVMVT